MSIAFLAASAATAAQMRLVVAQGAWVSFERGQSCEAVARSIRIAKPGEEQSRVAITFDRRGPRHGQFSARFRRPVRDGSSPILTVGSQPFLLVARGQDAWSSGVRQESAIIGAIRMAGGMRIESRAADGRTMVDRYLLDGAPTAIDAAAAACVHPR